MFLDADQLLHEKFKNEIKKIFKAATVNPYLFSLLCIFLKLFNPLQSILLRDKTIPKNQKDIV